MERPFEIAEIGYHRRYAGPQAGRAVRADRRPAVAIDQLVDGLRQGLHHQVLLGATGTGKTFSIASVIAQVNRPTLVLAHNKTLAAQLYAEFREFFPDNAVEYFVSYFDYYQPEAYLPRSDTYIEKDSAATTRSTGSAMRRRMRCSSGAT